MIRWRSQLSPKHLTSPYKQHVEAWKGEVFDWESTKFSVSHVQVTTLLLLNNLANLLTPLGIHFLAYKNKIMFQNKNTKEQKRMDWSDSYSLMVPCQTQKLILII